MPTGQVITTILTGLYAHDRDVGVFRERMEVINSQRQSNRPQNGDGLNGHQRRRRLILGPFVLLRTMTYDPVVRLDSGALLAAYTIDINQHHDFFAVTVSRLCYYCGSSVQTFFLYFVHDIIGVLDNPESAVAELAVASQIAGALVCYPVGWISDRYCGGRRKLFVYLACTLLGGVTLSMIFAKTIHQMTILCFILGAANGMMIN
jgi:MFS family permease